MAYAVALRPPAARLSAAQAAGWTDGLPWQGWAWGAARIALIIVLTWAARAAVGALIRRLTARTGPAVKPAAVPGGGLAAGARPASRRAQRAQTVGSVARALGSFLITGTAALMVLSVLGLDLAPLLTGAGVAGLAVGIGARSLVADVLAGICVILEDQYGVGDQIDTGEARGTVVAVGLRVTVMQGEGGEIWYVRNGAVQQVANTSQGWSTVTLDIHIGYGEDAQQVEAVITAAARAMAEAAPWDGLLREPARLLGMEAVTADAVIWRLEARTAADDSEPVRRELLQRLKTACDTARIPLLAAAALAPDPAPQMPPDPGATAAASPAATPLPTTPANQNVTADAGTAARPS
ncbi:mechanosensitive ion channel domain-containing protein [Streptomyces sp. CdTB01]|uniref:mechanosensitive ion channel family protein n=1 Tax=Streptomyces sp. CdTB01 TaxID=1725411 RepID=UPI00073A7BD7|nr:mechanosensitive ion channel domain-containing protein [Streptomyces sp. CdTB01]ALV39221.1 hypothetical protein AS200_44810 [Streptomyces sp. CdTB01]